MLADEAVGELTAALGESKSLRDVYEVHGDLSKRSSKSKLEVLIGDWRSLLDVIADMELCRRIVDVTAVAAAESPIVGGENAVWKEQK
jgi:hypothetical protein